jgi:methyltransferase-like protein
MSTVCLRNPEENLQNVIVDKLNDTIIDTLKCSSIPDTMKSEIEKIVKEIVTKTCNELLEKVKKMLPIGSIDADGDGVITITEVKKAAKNQIKKWGCCSIA